MKAKLILSVIFTASLVTVGCTPKQKGATTGVAAGAAIGALAAGDGNRGTGALIGGAVGGVAGLAVGANQEKKQQQQYYQQQQQQPYGYGQPQPQPGYYGPQY